MGADLDPRADDDLQRWKIAIARRQLGAALAMFIRDQDPVSVHCLACGGGEVLGSIAHHTKSEPFATHILKTHPGMNLRYLRGLRNQYWNAFKHATAHTGQLRNDLELLEAFADEQNDPALFIGWWDYHQVTRRLPVAAQVFQAWYYAMYEIQLAPDYDRCDVRRLFPEIASQDRREQKRRLRRMVDKWDGNKGLLSDPGTERGPLLLRREDEREREG